MSNLPLYLQNTSDIIYFIPFNSINYYSFLIYARFIEKNFCVIMFFYIFAHSKTQFQNN